MGEPPEIVVGLDEAGVGAAYGSLWAAAVALRSAPPAGLTDSKKLTPARREKLREAILASDALCAWGEVTSYEIDEHGLGEARRLVFERALETWSVAHDRMPDRIVVDGTLYRPWRDVPYECMPKADLHVPCVSAASILAKTRRDAQVDACDDELDARYALRSNKGYLSARHIEGIRTYGYGPEHRLSYRIRALENH